MRLAASCMIASSLVLSSVVQVFAAPFGPKWTEQWTEVSVIGEPAVTRHDDGALEIDATPKEHVWYFGGEEMHDFPVSAKVKFLSAEGKAFLIVIFRNILDKNNRLRLLLDGENFLIKTIVKC